MNHSINIIFFSLMLGHFSSITYFLIKKLYYELKELNKQKQIEVLKKQIEELKNQTEEETFF